MEKIPNITFCNDEGDEVTLDCVYEVCHHCEGKGKMVNPAIDGHGFTRRDFDEDPGFYEDYISGVYDIPCPECKGKRVIPVPCRFTNSEENLKAYDKYCLEEETYRAECEMERRMGC